MRGQIPPAAPKSAKNMNNQKTETAGAKFDPAKTYKTRDGRVFRYIGRSSCPRFPVVGDIMAPSGHITLERWTEYGRFFDNDGSSRESDLIEVPPPPAQVPFTYEDIVPLMLRAIFRHKGTPNHWFVATSVMPHEVRMGAVWDTHTVRSFFEVEYSLDHGKTWNPCTKPAPANTEEGGAK